MGRIKVLREGGIVEDNDVSCDVAVDNASRFLLEVGSFRKKSIDLLCYLSGHEISSRCLPLVCNHDTVECARLLLKGGHRIPASLVDTRVMVDGMSTETSIHISIMDATLSMEDTSPRGGNERNKILLCTILLLNQAGVAPLRNHYIDWRSLYLPAMVAKVRGMNIKETLLVADVHVKDNVELYLWLSLISGKHDPRIMWHLLKNGASIFQSNINELTPLYSSAAKRSYKALQDFIAVHNSSVSFVKLLRFKAIMELQNLRKHGLIHMAAFLAVHINQNPASMVQCYSSNQKDHVIIKESGNWLRDDDLEDLNESDTWPKTSAGNRHSFLPGACRMCVVPAGNGPATLRVHLQLLLQPKDELAEWSSDHLYPTSPLTATESKSELKYPIFPLATCITRDSSRDTGTQQVYAYNESNVNIQFGDKCNMSNTLSEQDGDTIDNDNLLIPVFLRHVSGELVLNVNVDLSSQHLMHLYALKTKTKLEYQYFVYNKKRLEPDRSLLFYGVQRDTTIHVCSGLLGGVITTLEQYVDDNKSKFTIEVTLPTGELSLQLTNLGCQFISSWINCFTTAFSIGLSWNGEFTLKSFKYFEGHIRKHRKPKVHGYGAMGNDLEKFIHYVEEILCSKNGKLKSQYPPYLEHLKSFLNGLVIREVRLPNEIKLYLDTAVCCMTSFARERLIIELFRKYEGLDKNEIAAWDDAISSSHCSSTWYTELYAITFFKEIIDKAIKEFGGYKKTKIGAFRFMRDIVMHGADYHEEKDEKVQYDDGNELMIPAFFKDFLPDIIKNLIMKNIDITAELEAAIQCACTICDS